MAKVLRLFKEDGNTVYEYDNAQGSGLGYFKFDRLLTSDIMFPSELKKVEGVDLGRDDLIMLALGSNPIHSLKGDATVWLLDSDLSSTLNTPLCGNIFIAREDACHSLIDLSKEDEELAIGNIYHLKDGSCAVRFYE